MQSVRIISVETPTHGRVLVRDGGEPGSSTRLLVGFHGYGQGAEEMLAELALVPGNERWTLVSVQALHRFYARAQDKVVACWMTRQDREQAIADNVNYVNRALDPLVSTAEGSRLVFAGFSQGVAMAYRAAVLGAHRPQHLIAVAGDVPPDLHGVPSGRFPAVMIAAGQSDEWYSKDKMDADERILREIGVNLELFSFRGGHEWTPELRERIGRLIR